MTNLHQSPPCHGIVLLTLCYWWSGFPPNIDDYVINPSGVNQEHASRRKLDVASSQWQLFDPELYLSILDGEVHSRTCEKLATYSDISGASSS